MDGTKPVAGAGGALAPVDWRVLHVTAQAVTAYFGVPWPPLLEPQPDKFNPYTVARCQAIFYLYRELDFEPPALCAIFNLDIQQLSFLVSSMMYNDARSPYTRRNATINRYFKFFNRRLDPEDYSSAFMADVRLHLRAEIDWIDHCHDIQPLRPAAPEIFGPRLVRPGP